MKLRSSLVEEKDVVRECQWGVALVKERGKEIGAKMRDVGKGESENVQNRPDAKAEPTAKVRVARM